VDVGLSCVCCMHTCVFYGACLHGNTTRVRLLLLPAWWWGREDGDAEAVYVDAAGRGSAVLYSKQHMHAIL
jgi:hypothetical protein